MRLIRLTAPLFVPVLALLGALLTSACSSDDSVERMFQADAAAIRADKAQMDLDSGNPAAFARDLHQLYADTEKQEHDRGTEDDEFQEGEW